MAPSRIFTPFRSEFLFRSVLRSCSVPFCISARFRPTLLLRSVPLRLVRISVSFTYPLRTHFVSFSRSFLLSFLLSRSRFHLVSFSCYSRSVPRPAITSKPQANHKRTTSKPQANHKQTPKYQRHTISTHSALSADDVRPNSPCRITSAHQSALHVKRLFGTANTPQQASGTRHQTHDHQQTTSKSQTDTITPVTYIHHPRCCPCRWRPAQLTMPQSVPTS